MNMMLLKVSERTRAETGRYLIGVARKAPGALCGKALCADPHRSLDNMSLIKVRKSRLQSPRARSHSKGIGLDGSAAR